MHHPRLTLMSFTAALLSTVACVPAHAQPARETPRIRPGFNDRQQVGFMLLDADGKAHRITSDPHGSTNTVVLAIDGKNHVFGFETGAFVGKPQPLGNGRIGKKASWAISKIEVTQTVETVASKTGHLDTCLVTYAIANEDDKPHTIGLRVLLDTFIEDNDANAFRLLASKELITKQADFKGKDVPALVLALQHADVNKPGLVAVLTLSPGGILPAPDRLSLTRCPDRDGAFGWEIAVRDIGNDAVAAIYWNAGEIKPGSTRTVGYGYGGGEVEIK